MQASQSERDRARHRKSRKTRIEVRTPGRGGEGGREEDREEEERGGGGKREPGVEVFSLGASPVLVQSFDALVAVIKRRRCSG